MFANRFTVSVSCRVDGEQASVSFTTFRRTLIQQIMDSSLAFFKISPSQSQTAQLILGGKQVVSFTPQSTVEDLKLTSPDRQSLELVLLDEEPEVSFPVCDQYGAEEVLRARLYHPFLDAVKRLLESSAIAQPGQPQPPLDVDLYRSSDVSPVSLQNSPAACGLQGGEQLWLYRYGRCSREYWQQQGQPERGLQPTFAGLYISDFKNHFQGRAVFRHDLAMPLEPLLATYCQWRGIELGQASFLWLQFYMRLSLSDSGVARGMDDGDTIYIFDKQDPQGQLWDAVLDGDALGVQAALDAGATLHGPPGSFEAITWPLHAAAANNHLDTKADYAALCHAAEKGSLAMVQLLLAKGANPYTYDDTGYCAYDYLVDQAKPLELLNALLQADNAFGSTQKSYQQAYVRLCAAVKRAQRYPALGCNCRTCNSVVEVRAAEAEATQTLKAQIGCVALVRAVQAGGPQCLEAMQLLHAHGALLDGQDQDGRTALHQAIRYNRLAEARWLTKKQETGTSGRKTTKKRNALDVTGLTTIGGNSALALAVRHGHAAVVEYLLSQGATFDLKNAADSSAFHAALDRGAASVASKLLQHLNK
ncbi:ankyrin repeat-containing domain protein, partial [Haematococcus lacustris]